MANQEMASPASGSENPSAPPTRTSQGNPGSHPAVPHHWSWASRARPLRG